MSAETNSGVAAAGRKTVGMKIAVAGKGGAGKTTTCATMARHLARSGHHVVAIDGDTNPNLAPALGLAPGSPQPDFLPPSLVARRFDGPRLTESVADVLARFAVTAPDGVHLLRMGAPKHADEGCLCSAHATVSALMADLETDGTHLTVLDLEASPEHLSRGTARNADVLLLIAEPYFRSLEAVRLQATLAAETAIGRVAVVANKCRSQTDYDAIEEFCGRHGIELVGRVPFDEAVLDADAAGEALIDFAPESAAVAAIVAAADAVMGEPIDPSVPTTQEGA